MTEDFSVRGQTYQLLIDEAQDGTVKVRVLRNGEHFENCEYSVPGDIRMDLPDTVQNCVSLAVSSVTSRLARIDALRASLEYLRDLTTRFKVRLTKLQASDMAVEIGDSSERVYGIAQLESAYARLRAEYHAVSLIAEPIRDTLSLPEYSNLVSILDYYNNLYRPVFREYVEHADNGQKLMENVTLAVQATI